MKNIEEKTKEDLIELYYDLQKRYLNQQIKSENLEKLNNDLSNKYKSLLENSFPTIYVKHLLKVSSCVIASGICGIITIANQDVLSLYSAIVYFVLSFIGSFIFPFILTFICEITDYKFLNEKVSPFAPYLIIPLVYLYIIFNFR